MRAGGQAELRGTREHFAATCDPAPLADVGLHEAQSAVAHRILEVREAADVLACCERDGARGGEIGPCGQRLVGSDRFLDPEGLELGELADALECECSIPRL